VAEKWTHLLQKEFAHQGEMENAVGMETTLFGGPPELGNMLKLANGQIGFMTIFAHPLFANVSDVIPAMSFAADEILTNKGVWFTRAEQEKRKEALRRESGHTEGGSISPRSQSPSAGFRKSLTAHNDKEGATHFSSPLRNPVEAPGQMRTGTTTPPSQSRKSSHAAVAGLPIPGNEAVTASRRSSGASKTGLKAPQRPSLENRRSNNSNSSQRQLNDLALGGTGGNPRNRSSENDDPNKDQNQNSSSSVPWVEMQRCGLRI